MQRTTRPDEAALTERLGRSAWSSTLVLLALLFAFLPLAFSEDLLSFARDDLELSAAEDPHTLNYIDAAIYVVIGVLLVPIWLLERGTRLTWRWLPKNRTLPVSVGILSAYTVSLVSTMLLDYYYQVIASDSAVRTSQLTDQLASCVWYLIPQLLVFLAVAWARGDAGRPRDIWADGIPLLGGTFATWVALVLVWPVLVDLSDGLRVNQEFFAQISQLIPILLIALAFELQFFSRSGPRGLRAARSATVLAIVAIGEVAALLCLLRSGSDAAEETITALPYGWLLQWVEYAAFIVTVNAVTVALTALVWALLSGPLVVSRRPGADTESVTTEKTASETVGAQETAGEPVDTQETSSDTREHPDAAPVLPRTSALLQVTLGAAIGFLGALVVLRSQQSAARSTVYKPRRVNRPGIRQDAAINSPANDRASMTFGYRASPTRPSA